MRMLAPVLLAAAAALAAPRAGAADPVLRWNQVALDAVAADHGGAREQAGPTRGSRALAIVHAAVYDAFQRLPRGAWAQAAIARAARDTLAALYPSQQGVFDAALALEVQGAPSQRALVRGLAAGERAARRVLRQRRRDGADAAMPWTPSAAPGRHREDPLHPDQGFLTPGWGDVRPFVLRRGDEMRPPPPPPLDSAAYAAALEEVRRLGGDGLATPTERIDAETEVGTFWGYDGTPGLGVPPRLYNQIARVVAQQQGNGLEENARLFLLVNLALADAGIACWEAKYHYDFWRPVVAIREDAASPDPAFTPLGAPASNASGTDFTPPFPAYPSGHATFGAALFRILALFYGSDAMAFDFVSDEMNGVTTDWAGVVRPLRLRSFASFSEAAWENAESRIYLGIHWRFDATEGVALGEAVADRVFERALTRRGRRR
jgi:membrane-associated phospholipid phosphatase